jgi:hypothetical protein
MKTASTATTLCFILISSTFYVSSCRHDSASLTQTQYAMVKNSVTEMVESISKNVSDKGPVAWLLYFENAPDFFMASEGQLKFPNIDTATNFINKTLVRNISKIELHWSHIRIDPLTRELASIGAIFHEDILNTDKKTIPVDGYFTGIAHQTPQGWKLRNAHWSTLATH